MTVIDKLMEIPIEEVVRRFGYPLVDKGNGKMQVAGRSGVSDFSSLTIDTNTNTGFYGKGLFPVNSPGLYCLLATKGHSNSYRNGENKEEIEEMEREFLLSESKPQYNPRKISPPKPVDRTQATKKFKEMRIQDVHPVEYYHQHVTHEGKQWYQERYGIDVVGINGFRLGEVHETPVPDQSTPWYWHMYPWPGASIPWYWHRRDAKSYNPQYLQNAQIRFFNPPVVEGKETERYRPLANGLESRILFNLDSLVRANTLTILFEGAMKSIKITQEYWKAGKNIQAISLPNVAGWKGWASDDSKKNWHNVFTPQSYNFLDAPVKDLYIVLDPDAHQGDNTSMELARHLQAHLPQTRVWNCLSSIKPDDFFQVISGDNAVFKFEQAVLVHGRRVGK